MGRPRLHFDGEPNRFTAMQQLFNAQSTLRVKYATHDDRKVRLRRITKSLSDWYAKYGTRRSA